MQRPCKYCTVSTWILYRTYVPYCMYVPRACACTVPVPLSSRLRYPFHGSPFWRSPALPPRVHRRTRSTTSLRGNGGDLGLRTSTQLSTAHQLRSCLLARHNPLPSLTMMTSQTDHQNQGGTPRHRQSQHICSHYAAGFRTNTRISSSSYKTTLSLTKRMFTQSPSITPTGCCATRIHKGPSSDLRCWTPQPLW